jgi:transcriptional regulator with PAS, ATPase and Fis domain
MTRPLEALADATVEIGKGDYSHRVTVEATAEMAELVRSFNHMAADLEQSRMLAETSARELSTANLAIEARRKELETILETIPSGVVTLDAAQCVVLANRAFVELVRLDSRADFAGVSLDSLLPPEFTEAWVRRPQNSNCAHRAEPLVSPSLWPLSISTTAASVVRSWCSKMFRTSSTRRGRQPGKKSRSALRMRSGTHSPQSRSPPSAFAATSNAALLNRRG